jgi:1-acyl-sn-glycerol-3-phosphate acyltransferase
MMTLAQKVIIKAFRILTNLLCRINGEQLARVPDKGPLIIVTNHINILEIPVIYTRLQPRSITGFVAEYRWENRWLRWLLQVCEAIPLHRGEADITAMRRALDVLEEGYILVVAPEGTRSGHGQLQKAHPGAVLLALHSGAPLLPLVFYGHEHWIENLRRFRRTDIHIAVGELMHLDARGVKITRQVRRQMIDEVMCQMAALLPLKSRGVYSDSNVATEMYLTFQPDT